MRTNILFYYYGLYITQNKTLSEITQPAFIRWLHTCSEEDLIKKDDHQPIFRHFQKMVKLGYLDKTGKKTDDGFTLYKINRPDSLELPKHSSDSDFLLRVFFYSMLADMDYQHFPAMERVLLQRSLTEPRGVKDAENIVAFSELIRWVEHPIVGLTAQNRNHLQSICDAFNSSTSNGNKGIAAVALDLYTDNSNQSITVYPLEIQVKGEVVLLFALSLDKTHVQWIPLREIDEVSVASEQPHLAYNCGEYIDALSLSQIIQADMLIEYSMESLLNCQTIVLQLDAIGWKQLTNRTLPVDAELCAQTLRLELYHPITPSLVRWVMSYGRHMKVISPVSLKDSMRKEMELQLS